MTHFPVESPDYDPIARLYSPLTTLVSLGGNRSLQRSQLAHLERSHRVLTVGCGSVGFNLDLVAACDHVTFLDLSERMLSIVRNKIRRVAGAGRHSFVHGDVMEHKSRPYDAVLANFVLNCFSPTDCPVVVGHLTQLVAPGGILGIADESATDRAALRVLQRLVRRGIYDIHRLFVNHPHHEIHDFDGLVFAHGFRRIAIQRGPFGATKSCVYRSPPAPKHGSAECQEIGD